MAEGRRLNERQLELDILRTRHQEAKSELESRLYHAQAGSRVNKELRRQTRVAPYRVASGWRTVPRLLAGVGPADNDILHQRNLQVALSP